MYVSLDLPEPLEEALRESGGGICLPKRLLSQRTVEYCKDAGLDLWVFTAESEEEFHDLASKDGVDAVFCDKAKEMME